MKRAALTAAALALCGGAAAQEIELRGQIAFEPRLFLQSPADEDQFSGLQLSAFAEPEFRWRSGDRDTQVQFTPFLRLDARDGERSHFDIREAYVRHVSGDFEFLVGLNRVFWGVTESRHLVNIINQVDAVEDIDEEDFLGQPMLQLGWQAEFGRFDAYLMSGFRERTFPSRSGRLRGPVVDTDEAVFESHRGRGRPDLALRYSHYVGDLDVGLHVFHGTGREPERFVPIAGSDRLAPYYGVITQAGADLQYTSEAWLWKFEGLVREGQGDAFAAAVAGVEYTLFGIADSDADLGLLFEVLADGRDDDVFPTAAEHDVFVGARLALNDVSDTDVLAGVFVDAKEGPASLRVEAGRRLGERWKLEAEATAFLEHDSDDGAFPLRRDSFATLRLSYFF